MEPNRKQVKLKSGREVTIKALGMLTLRNLRGNLPIVARDESTPDLTEATDSGDDVDRGIDFVCAGCVEPNYVNAMEAGDGEVSVDDLSIGEFSELALAIKEISGIEEAGEDVRPLSRTGKA